ncbi:MAG TPA: aspartate aminotransferase family protein [Candidatus Omnitrophica bacterium]|nr:aspartate aminotransferase family protein [Candidatus Omnitrophota bacterium]
MKTADVEKLYGDFVLPTYKRMPICLVKGKGSRVWDLQNKEYLDFFPGWGVSGLGHAHPTVVHAIKNQTKKIVHVANNFYILPQAKLAQAIVKNGFPGRVFFCNSGAEANEAAIKFCRIYGSEAGRNEMITFTKSFHGRTMGAMSATGQDKIHHGFYPLVEKFSYAEFNDLESVKKLITPKTVGIMLEPVQGEGGIRVATQEFMQGLRKLCDEKNLLLVLDEVQTCMGRTGKMYAYQHYGIEPDIMTLAKSLGSGVPIGAMVVNRRIKKELFVPGTHGSTYGGNPLVCAAALAVFETIKKEKLLKQAVKMGEFLGAKLEELKKKYSVIEEVRGMGVMRALKLSVPSDPYAADALKQGLIINSTQGDVLRIMPALTVKTKEIEKAYAILDNVFQSLASQKN